MNKTINNESDIEANAKLFDKLKERIKYKRELLDVAEHLFCECSFEDADIKKFASMEKLIILLSNVRIWGEYTISGLCESAIDTLEREIADLELALK